MLKLARELDLLIGGFHADRDTDPITSLARGHLGSTGQDGDLSNARKRSNFPY